MLMWAGIVIATALLGAVLGYSLFGTSAVGTGPFRILFSFLLVLFLMTMIVMGAQYCSQTADTVPGL